MVESGNSMVFSLVGVVVSGRHREGVGVGVGVDEDGGEGEGTLEVGEMGTCRDS